MNVYAQRLLNVSKALRESPNPAGFDMGQYGYDTHEKHPCGTPACALGHYAFRIDLQSAFRLSMDGVYALGDGDWTVDYDDPPVQDHFGLTEDEAGELFAGDGCGNAKVPEQAATYIEKFVARKYPAQSFIAGLLTYQPNKTLEPVS